MVTEETLRGRRETDDGPPALEQDEQAPPPDSQPDSQPDSSSTGLAAAEEPQPIDGLIPGRIVHYVSDRPYSAGETPEIRPAIVVRVWDHFTGCVNLQVFTDGDNDLKFTDSRGSNVVWKTSRLYSKGNEPGTWHWPPRD